MVKLKSFSNAASQYVKSIPKELLNSTLDLLESSDFISRTVGMANSYNDIMERLIGLETAVFNGAEEIVAYRFIKRTFLHDARSSVPARARHNR